MTGGAGSTSDDLKKYAAKMEAKTARQIESLEQDINLQLGKMQRRMEWISERIANGEHVEEDLSREASELARLLADRTSAYGRLAEYEFMQTDQFEV